MPSLVHAGPANRSGLAGSVRVEVSASMAPGLGGPRLDVQTGKSVVIDLAKDANFRVSSGSDKIATALTAAGLEVTGRQAGLATVIVDTPAAAGQVYLVRVVDPGVTHTTSLEMAPAASPTPVVPAVPATQAAAPSPVTPKPIVAKPVTVTPRAMSPIPVTPVAGERAQRATGRHFA